MGTFRWCAHLYEIERYLQYELLLKMILDVDMCQGVKVSEFDISLFTFISKYSPKTNK